MTLSSSLLLKKMSRQTHSRGFSYKVTLVGEGSVGKTSLIHKFIKNDFIENYLKTIGASFSLYNTTVNSSNIRLLFWDIAGQADFSFLKPSFLKESLASIIVFSLEKNDLGNDSFQHIIHWYRDIRAHCDPRIPVFLFANKSDLVDPTTINHTLIQSVIDELNLVGYYITSAKTGAGVEEAFDAIIQYLYNCYVLNITSGKEKKYVPVGKKLYSLVPRNKKNQLYQP